MRQQGLFGKGGRFLAAQQETRGMYIVKGSYMAENTAREPSEAVVEPLQNAQRSCNALDKYIGRKLAEYRRAKGFSQTELGKPLGISYQQIQKYERGMNRISAGRLFLCASILHIDPMAFFPKDSSHISLNDLIEDTSIGFRHHTSKIGKPDIMHALEDLAAAISEQYPV